MKRKDWFKCLSFSNIRLYAEGSGFEFVSLDQDYNLSRNGRPSVLVAALKKI